jgi:hypothetical protein
MPPSPPENASFLATPETMLTSTGDPKVDAYRDRLLTDYTSAPWRPYLLRLFAGVRADPKIVERFDRLASIREPKDYMRHYVTPERIRRGRQLYRQLKASTKVKPTEMPLELRIALWGCSPTMALDGRNMMRSKHCSCSAPTSAGSPPRTSSSTMPRASSSEGLFRELA